MAELEGNDISAQDFIQEEIDAAEFQAMSLVQHFYNGATILITGATCLVGNMLIEKILRTTDVKRIYTLIRPKGNKPPSWRLSDMFDSLLFTSVKTQKPGRTDSVEALYADLSQSDLEISQEDREKLVSEVDIIFHCACVGFSESSLKKSILVNVRGTKLILQLAKEMRRLKAFVHVSTAYSNWLADDVNERFSKPPITYEKILNLVEILKDEHLLALQPTLLDTWPNPNTFTKFVAEDMIKNIGAGLPIAIIRPSIVTSTAYEPIVGWINNIYGPQGVAHWAYYGFLRVLHARGNLKLDIVPCDLTVNAMLSLAWDVGTTNGDVPNKEQLSYNEALNIYDLPSEEIPILNFVSGRSNPITWEIFIKLCLMASTPKIKFFALDDVIIQENYFIVWMYQALLHIIPAFIFDALHRITGRPTQYLSACQDMHDTIKKTSPYLLRQRRFTEKNTWALWNKLSPKDQALFKFNITSIDWQEYLQTYVKGIRTYIVKDDANTLCQARRTLIKLQMIYQGQTFLLILWIYIAWLLIKLIF